MLNFKLVYLHYQSLSWALLFAGPVRDLHVFAVFLFARVVVDYIVRHGWPRRRVKRRRRWRYVIVEFFLQSLLYLLVYILFVASFAFVIHILEHGYERAEEQRENHEEVFVLHELVELFPQRETRMANQTIARHARLVNDWTEGLFGRLVTIRRVTVQMDAEYFGDLQVWIVVVAHCFGGPLFGATSRLVAISYWKLFIRIRFNWFFCIRIIII